MSQPVIADQWVVIRIKGMHCHRCETAIQKRLSQIPGVHEAEVDFNSSQASILFDRALADVEKLVEAIQEEGYEAAANTIETH